MKKLLLAGVIPFCFFTCFEKNKCSDVRKCDLNVSCLVEKLNGGEWHYAYSYHIDTCFVIENFNTVDFPGLVKFEKSSDSVEISGQDPSLYERRQSDLFYNTKSIVTTDGKSYLTYPIAVFKRDSSDTINRIKVYHQSMPKDKVPLVFNYFITSLCGDSLTLQDEKVYNLNKEQISGVHHLFIRK